MDCEEPLSSFELQVSNPQISQRLVNLRESIRNQTDVALGITKQLLLNEGKDSNVVFSPSSINVLLSLMAAGSNGATLDELLCFLKSKSNDQLQSLASKLIVVVFGNGEPMGGPCLSFATGVWVDGSLSLKPSFKQVVDNAYKAALDQVDFRTKGDEVRSEVNSWAEKETSGLIKEVLPPGSVDNETRFVLANALYFKGTWNQKFDASATKEYDFYLLNGCSVQVPFMTSKKKQVARAFDGFKVLRHHYKRGVDERFFSLYFFLPDAKDGLPSLVEKVCSESSFLYRHLPHQEIELGVFRIPKFKISFGFEASNVLKGLGLVLPFCATGNLTEMVDSQVGQELYVSGIFHKSFIEVNEEGTGAAAISATGNQRRSVHRIEKIDFVADHPFLFLIREDRSGMILFVGHVLNPIAIPPAPAKQNESNLPHVVIPLPPAKHIERERFFQEKKMDGFGLSGHVRGHSLDSLTTTSSRRGTTDFSD
ncbi:serpin-ZX-like [Corylus avellana]|uniref:serpin-ZX-like n=1 Tax=Corylus avellana TaxID=13451 RepID=UPI00286C6B79|nr:serpin-ZX-like [Corylus avellana]